MKRILAMLLAIVSVLTLMAWPVSAAPVDLDELFQSNLNFLDQYYTLGAEFMIQKLCGIMYPWEKAEELNYATIPTPAAEFEAGATKQKFIRSYKKLTSKMKGGARAHDRIH